VFPYLVFGISQLFYALLYASFLVTSCMIIPNYSLTPLWIYAYFIGIFLAGLQGQTWFALMCTYVSYYVFPYVSLLYGERASCMNTEVTAHLA